MVLAFSSMMAVRYCLAAERDGKDGFPLAAAMEWRKAAELLGPNAHASDRCWREWERIMHLPRRLAGSIGAFNATPCASPRPTARTIAAVSTPHNIPLAAA